MEGAASIHSGQCVVERWERPNSKLLERALARESTADLNCDVCEVGTFGLHMAF